jgi:aspartyl aminopeptidase
VEDEFIFIGRLDNLGMSYLSLQALIDSTSEPAALANEAAIKAVALFDHEEVGSASAQGDARSRPKLSTLCLAAHTHMSSL